jgi:hypothetical protein
MAARASLLMRQFSIKISVRAGILSPAVRARNTLDRTERKPSEAEQRHPTFIFARSEQPYARASVKCGFSRLTDRVSLSSRTLQGK